MLAIRRVSGAFLQAAPKRGASLLARKLKDGEPFTVLGIESSFDDTGVAIVRSDKRILANKLISQRDVHKRTGGTVPTIAKELHEKNLPIATEEALATAQLKLKDVDAIAVTLGPGIGPSLQAGVRFAQQLAVENEIPLYPVHHMEAHALTARMTNDISFPFLVLLASGGHCLLLLAEGVGKLRRLGTCLDDSPGEAFDKIARALDLKSGGPEIEALARKGDGYAFSLPLPLSQQRNCDFSFSGLKSSVFRIIQEQSPQDRVSDAFKADLCASFQRVAFEHILTRSHRAILYCREHLKIPLSHMVVSGGVACNQYLREQLDGLGALFNVTPVFPPPALCCDNGAMIAWVGVESIRAGVQPYRNVQTPLFFRPKWPLGENDSAGVALADISVDRKNIRHSIQKQHRYQQQHPPQHK